jgi:hypothetical protein
MCAASMFSLEVDMISMYQVRVLVIKKKLMRMSSQVS